MIPVFAFLCLLVSVTSAQDYDEVRSQNKWWSDYSNLYDYDDAEIDKRMNLIITKNILPGDAPLPLDERLFFRAPGSSEEVDFVPVQPPSPPPRRKTSRPPSNRRQQTSTAPPLPSSSPRSEPTRARIFPSTRRPLFRPFVTSPPPPTTEAEEEEPDSREEPEPEFNSQPEIRPLPVADSRPPEIPQASVLSDSQNVFVTRGIEAPKANQSPNRLPFIPPPAGVQRPRPSSARPPSEIPVTTPLPPPAAHPLPNAPPRPSRPDKELFPSSAIPPKFFSSTQNPFSSNLPPNLTPVLPGRPQLSDFHSSPVTSDFTRSPNGGSSLPPLSQAPLQNSPIALQPLVSPNPVAPLNSANIPPQGNGNINGNGRRTQVLKRRLRPSSTASPLDDSEEAEIANERVASPAIQLTQDVSRVRSQNPRLQAPLTASEAPVISKSSKKPLGNSASVSPAKSSPSSFNSPTGFAPSRTFTPPPLLNPHLSPARGTNRSVSPQTNNVPRNQGLSPQPQQFSRGTTLRQPIPPNGEFPAFPPQHPFQGGAGRFQGSVSTLPPPQVQSSPPPHRPAAVRRRPVIVSSTNAPLDDIQPRSPEHEVRGRVRVAGTTAIPTHAFVSSPSPRASTLRDSSDIHISSNTEIIPPSALREAISPQRVARVPANRAAAAGERSSTRFQRDETRRRNAMLIAASSSPVGMAAKPDGSFEFVPDVDDLNLLSQLSALSDNSLPSTTTSPNPFHGGQFLPEAIKFIFGAVENERWKNNTMVGSEMSAKSWTPPCVRNGRNFCPHTDFYPNALVERVVKEHVVEVSKLFNELRSFEKPSLSTPHSEDEKGQFVCESQVGVIRPGWVRDVTTGDWLVVINTEEFSQLVRIETCSRPNEACLFIAPYYRSSCREHHSVQRLVAIDPQAAAPTPRVALVQMPCGCSCMVGTGQTRQTPIR